MTHSTETQISFAKAIKAYEHHGFGIEELLADIGRKAFYTATEILTALGY